MIVEWGPHTIQCKVRRADTDRLSITVCPERRVTVRAPQAATEEEIRRRVTRRAAWIVRQIRYFEQFLPKEPARRYVSGETHRYLGRQYRLKVTSGAEVTAKLKGRFLEVIVPIVDDAAAVEAAVENWYLTRAKALFTARLQECHRRAGTVLKAPVPELLIRRMKRRWGSLTPGGRLILHPDLVKSPLACIDYVILHELCHLRERNHGPKFYRLLARLSPDHETLEKRLERQAR